jgi:hypothetical protein
VMATLHLLAQAATWAMSARACERLIAPSPGDTLDPCSLGPN